MLGSNSWACGLGAYGRGYCLLTQLNPGSSAWILLIFWARLFLLCVGWVWGHGNLLCIVGWLAAFVVSTHWILVEPSPPVVLFTHCDTKNMSFKHGWVTQLVRALFRYTKVVGSIPVRANTRIHQ